jgi:uncharacterized phiE125 gp8 family phage protein
VSFPPYVYPPCHCTSSEGTSTNGWDAGISWRTDRTVDPTDIPLPVAYMRDKVLRVVNGSVEDGHIENLIITATEDAEQQTQRAIMPQTWQMILSGFPSGDIELERPPLIEVVSFGYVDADGNDQTLATSPVDFQIITSGKYRKARVRPSAGASWPVAQSGVDAVTITYRAGYANDQTPEFVKIRQGIALMVAELYKQRELSVVGTSIVPSIITMDRFWRKVY